MGGLALGLGAIFLLRYSIEAGVFSLRLIQTEGAPVVSVQSVAVEALEARGLAALSEIEPIWSGGASSDASGAAGAS